MRTVFPKNIQRGLLAGLTFSIGPFSVSIIQLFILAIGIALAFVAFNKFAESSKPMAIGSAIFVFLIFLVIAFFKISELNLLTFTVKFLQNHFFDTTVKYQTNHQKASKTQLLIEKFKTENTKQKIEYKTWIQLDGIDKLDSSWLLG